MVSLAATRFTMGSDDPRGYAADGEGPAHPVGLSSFSVDATTVTVDDFGAFVDAVGHRTGAETYGWSFVFAGLLPDDFEDTRGVVATPWWRQVFGADWSHPEGPHSDVSTRGDHPVVHISWLDAMAYCAWAGTTLPTEAQWEYAAGGGLDGARFPWGEDLEPDGRHLMNVWQGTFPGDNQQGDGYYATAPVSSYPPNGHGLYEMTGNVWEWCADWFDPRFDRSQQGADPSGSPIGESRVMKGGSYLCHASYCHRYRVPARAGNSPDTSTGHLGFRTVRD
jgi:sulfatase modifying factor 1